jgi:hypothetical protein
VHDLTKSTIVRINKMSALQRTGARRSFLLALHIDTMAEDAAEPCLCLGVEFLQAD